MGKPDIVENFEEFEVEGISIYIDKIVLEEYLEENKLYINLEGYGRYLFEIVE